MEIGTDQTCKKCFLLCGKGNVDRNVVKELEIHYEKLQQNESNSLLKKYLTPDLFNKLKNIETPMKSTLLDCIRSGLENPDSSIGVYAADIDCFIVFRELFDPIIEEYHCGFTFEDKHPSPYWGSPANLPMLDYGKKYIVSTRIRTARTLIDFPFGPRLIETQFRLIECKLIDALKTLNEENAGKYYPLYMIPEEEKQKLIKDHFMFKESDRFLKSAGISNYWPVGRGNAYISTHSLY